MSPACEAGLASTAEQVQFAPMVFTQLKPQMEQLPHDEMVKALAFLRSRLRADTAGNREELARHHAEMDAGKKVHWEDLKRQLGLS